MDHGIPQWLDAAVQAAGISMIYNAEDWARMTKAPAANHPHMEDPAANDPSHTQH
jgi:hypothetical protein